MARMMQGTARKDFSRGPQSDPQIRLVSQKTARPEFSLYVNEEKEQKSSTIFPITVAITLVLTLFTALFLNTLAASLAVKQQNVQSEIEETNQNIDSVRVAIEEKTTTIAQRATKLGMFAPDTFFHMSLEKHKIDKQTNTIEEAHAAEQSHTN